MPSTSEEVRFRCTPGVRQPRHKPTCHVGIPGLIFRPLRDENGTARTRVELDAVETAIARYERVAVVEGSVGEHLDFAFHLAVAEASGNARFVVAIRTLAFDIDHGVNLLRYLARFHHLERNRSMLADHTQVFEAIWRREPAAAEAAMRQHPDHARVRMIHSRPPADTAPSET